MIGRKGSTLGPIIMLLLAKDLLLLCHMRFLHTNCLSYWSDFKYSWILKLRLWTLINFFKFFYWWWFLCFFSVQERVDEWMMDLVKSMKKLDVGRGANSLANRTASISGPSSQENVLHLFIKIRLFHSLWLKNIL